MQVAGIVAAGGGEKLVVVLVSIGIPASIQMRGWHSPDLLITTTTKNA